MRRSGAVLLVLVSAAAGACGDGGGGISAPPVPRLIPGGGVGDGKISGYLNVFVIDDETDAVVSSAAVRVGDSAATTACDALTDSTGIASFDPPSCPSLVGPRQRDGVGDRLRAQHLDRGQWPQPDRGRARRSRRPRSGARPCTARSRAGTRCPRPPPITRRWRSSARRSCPGSATRERDGAGQANHRRRRRRHAVPVRHRRQPVRAQRAGQRLQLAADHPHGRAGSLRHHPGPGHQGERRRQRRHVHGDRLGVEAEPVVRQRRQRQRRGAGDHPRRRHAEPGRVVRVGAVGAGLRRRATDAGAGRRRADRDHRAGAGFDHADDARAEAHRRPRRRPLRSDRDGARRDRQAAAGDPALAASRRHRRRPSRSAAGCRRRRRSRCRAGRSRSRRRRAPRVHGAELQTQTGERRWSITIFDARRRSRCPGCPPIRCRWGRSASPYPRCASPIPTSPTSPSTTSPTG